MRLRFWRWAHRRAEVLWHWIYYNRLPEGRLEVMGVHKSSFVGRFYVEYLAKDGTFVPVEPPSDQRSSAQISGKEV